MGFWWRVLGIDIVVMGCSNTLAQELPIARAMQSLSDDFDSEDESDGYDSLDEFELPIDGPGLTWLYPIDEESADDDVY